MNPATLIALSTLFPGPKVTVSGENVSVVHATGGQAGIEFNTDGTVDKNEDGPRTQVDVATDWIIPNAAAPDDYQIFATVTAGVDPDVAQSDAIDTWLVLTSQRKWSVDAITDKTQKDCTLDISIRKGTGPTLDTGSYNLYSENT